MVVGSVSGQGRADKDETVGTSSHDPRVLGLSEQDGLNDVQVVLRRAGRCEGGNAQQPAQLDHFEGRIHSIQAGAQLLSPFHGTNVNVTLGRQRAQHCQLMN